MHRDAWFPIGHQLPLAARATLPVQWGRDWQIFEPSPGWRVLIGRAPLLERWQTLDLVTVADVHRFTFGGETYGLIDGKHLALTSTTGPYAPERAFDALQSARAYRSFRNLTPNTNLSETLYVAALERFLPWSDTSNSSDQSEFFLSWLAGGVTVSVSSIHRLRSLTPWADEHSLGRVLAAADIEVTPEKSSQRLLANSDNPFVLHGRPNLQAFFQDHVIDIVHNPERYATLGIGFPGAIALHGPPGCGKTYAVEQLVSYLGWPSHSIDATSIGSPYIHETGRKIAALFDKAAEQAPSVVVIDEMDAFLSERTSDGVGQHRVEEIAEFLRRLADAPKQRVLVIGMTNRVDAIDPAVMRRGRFDHVLKVDMASEDEVAALLDTLIDRLPHATDVPRREMAIALAGRPLSDVTFAVREAARRSAREGSNVLKAAAVRAVLNEMPAASSGGPKVGFL